MLETRQIEFISCRISYILITFFWTFSSPVFGTESFWSETGTICSMFAAAEPIKPKRDLFLTPTKLFLCPSTTLTQNKKF